jgi:two-component system, OmpR family, alkaline phosphatase synthesis response regulator PhoP
VKNARILLVEDEPNIARGLLFNLEAEGCRVVHAGDGETALRLISGEEFSLVILDLTLPGIDGLEVCRQLRSADARLPILILTARTDERDRIEGLASGADDYLTKPFHLQEFLLRVEGILRRSRWYRPSTEESERVKFGSNEVDLVGQRVWTKQGEIDLTELEVKILRLFLQREGEVVSRADLLASVWGLAPDTETRSLDNFIVRLRKYFEENPAEPVHFLTVRGRGYRFRKHGG